MNDQRKQGIAYLGAALATVAMWLVIIAAGASLGYLVVQLAGRLW